ncbi:MAG: MBL fold metallo-hydrolase [bacterium]|nr:MBL fold metallo-hydrolase [bacterium]
MLIKLLGVRGSLPTPLRNQEYRQKLRGVVSEAIRQGLEDETQIDAFLKDLPPHLGQVFGGDTTCIAVHPASGEDIPYIVDCGTALRPLGDRLMEGPCGRGEGKVHIFFTHTHWDHIQGLPFFKPMYIPGNEIFFYSPFDNLESRLTRQQIDLFFPMPFEQSASTKHFVTLKEDAPIRFEDGTTVDFFPLRHPGGSFAYRFRRDGASFIFATDCEFTGQDLERDRADFEFFLNADLLVLDAQYTLDDHFSKFDWGHTSITMAINIACKWAVKNLVLTHHEPAYSDAKLFENFKSAIEHKRALQVERPRLYMAREGMQIQVGRRAAGTTEDDARADSASAGSALEDSGR